MPVGPGQRLQHRRRRPGTADGLLAAPRPLHVPRPGAEGLHREGRARLDADLEGQDREGLRDDPRRLQDGQHHQDVGDRRARRRDEQPRGASEQAASGRPCRATRSSQRRSGSRWRSHRLVTDDGIPKRRLPGLSGAAVSNTGSRPDRVAEAPAAAVAQTNNPLIANRLTAPPARVTVGKNVGLHMSLLQVPRTRQGDVLARADFGVGRHARRREFAVGADLGCADAAGGWQGARDGDLRRHRAPTCCAPVPTTAA